MGDALLNKSENRVLKEEDQPEAREGTADAGDGEELHGKSEESKTEDQQENSGEDIEEQKSGGDGAAEEEEEPGECGFCLFMKSGPCRDSFVNWEQCIEQAEKDKEDMVEKCHKVTFMLKECMEHNSDYYEPVLQAEKAMGEAALEEEEAAAAAVVSAPQDGANADSSDSQMPLQSDNEPSQHPQVPEHVGAEVDQAQTDNQHTQARSEEQRTHTSKPDSAAQEHPSV